MRTHRRKRWCALAAALMMVLGLLGAAAASDEAWQGLDLAALTDEELTALRLAIDEQLLSRQVYPFVQLERGASGTDVERLQQQLVLLGFAEQLATAKYDSATQRAMKAFERANQLPEDGVASPEDQRLLFGGAAVPNATPTLTVQRAPVTPNPLKDLYADIPYDQLARYPEQYEGQAVYFKGRVEQVLGTRQEGFEIRLSVLQNTANMVYVYIPLDPGYNVLEGDRLEIYAKFRGPISYKAVFGQTVTIPSAIADQVELLSR